MEADLADENQTRALANELGTRGDVLGIVNNVGIAKHETIDAVEFGVFSAVMDLNVRPALQLTQAYWPICALLDSAALSTSRASLLGGSHFVEVTQRQKQHSKA